MTTFQFVTPAEPGPLTLELELTAPDGTSDRRAYSTFVEDAP